MSAVTLHDVTLGYDRNPVVHHLSGIFAPGSLTAVCGPNGAGKSTLLKGIAGILTPKQGHIGISPTYPGGVSYLPQLGEFNRDFPITIQQMVAAGAWDKAGNIKSIGAVLKAKSQEAITAVGLSGLENRQIGRLSAGQFQRALFARLIMQDSPLLLLDEPFASVDTDTTQHLLDLLLAWHAQGRTVICALHDLGQIKRYFQESLLLARELVAWGKTDDVLTPDYLQRAKFFRDSWEYPVGVSA